MAEKLRYYNKLTTKPTLHEPLSKRPLTGKSKSLPYKKGLRGEDRSPNEPANLTSSS